MFGELPWLHIFFNLAANDYGSTVVQGFCESCLADARTSIIHGQLLHHKAIRRCLVSLPSILYLKLKMAADHPNTAVNGSYGAHSSYNQPEPYQPSQAPEVSSGNGVASSMGQDASATLATTNTATADVDNKPAQKEHIGWYFVEQYYKTMSKEPGRLYVR